MYNAAMEGELVYYNFSVVDHLTRDEENGYQVTPKGNTILHVAALFGQRAFVGEVLKISPALLCYKNNKNETALHIAANVGQSEVVNELLSIQGQETVLVRMTDDIGDTALHKAVRSGHIHIVRILMKLLLDPEHDFPANKAKETPLYLAAESGFRNALKEILKVCREPTHVAGPFNRTPLHAAVIQQHTKCAMALLQWNEDLCEEYDEWGWNSLHYAVKQGLTEIVLDMLRRNKSLAYKQAGSENDWTTAFHIAASEGHEAIIHKLLQYCPDCWEMVDSNGQNALHVAILNDGKLMVKLLREFRFCDSLVDEADNDGNTPLHLLAAYGKHLPLSELFHPSVKKMTFNKQAQTPLDIASSRTLTTEKEKLVAVLRKFNARLGQRCNSEVQRQSEIQEMRKKDEEARANRETLKMEKIQKSTEIQIVVATLIMTVAFAAAFTLPGGLENDNGPNKGMSILSKKTAFRAFVISDVLAFTCAAAAIHIYSTMANYDVVAGEINVPLLNIIRINYNTASNLQRSAMTAVVVAFVAGIYATLENSHALAVSVCVIGCVFFAIIYIINVTWVMVNNHFRLPKIESGRSYDHIFDQYRSGLCL
ncbi:hypothetical protein EJD97_010888 [Solanum chilense]|uniref:PGG domain-containing protein n=1 Tax=Solanum chilense TaxID=4083 RepID=A0A6N2BFX4_SOLCI|nr:hypothetical protein EJD97_010888 [Solanum chilense]